MKIVSPFCRLCPIHAHWGVRDSLGTREIFVGWASVVVKIISGTVVVAVVVVVDEVEMVCN